MLPDRIAGWAISYFDVLDSTNAEAKRRALSGTQERTVFAAGTQTLGRGRMTRRWESPAGAGLWMTQLLFPQTVAAKDAGGAVFLGAVALCKCLRDRTGADVRIKWPNDLVLNGKKLCGMLAECGLDGDRCDWLALGIGLNLRKGMLPGDLVYASSVEEETGLVLTEEAILRDYLLRFDELETLWERDGLRPVLERMRPLSATLGKEIRVNGEHAFALDVTEDGALLVRGDDGAERIVRAGDVSVRGITDYV